MPQSFSSAWLAGQLRQLAGTLKGARFCLGFSGGADSTALLAAAAAARSRYGFQLRAVHINHHLQFNAERMARSASTSARQLGVRCAVVDAPVQPKRGDSIEAAARTARNAALRAQLRVGEWLLLAQHQEDQAETVLLQLLRGSGVAGLAAMPTRRETTLRPLLAVTRVQLLAYLARRKLSWIDDPSNADERFDRNYLRLRVLPVLRARWPAFGVTIGRSATLAAEAQGLLNGIADVGLAEACDGTALRVSALRCLEGTQRHLVLRRWLECRGVPMPDQRRLREIAGPMLRARFDAQPSVAWIGALVRRHGDLLYAETQTAAAAAPMAGGAVPLQWNWLRKRRFTLPDGTCLELRSEAHAGGQTRAELPRQVRVEFRAGASVGASVGASAVQRRSGAKRLKRLLQSQAKLPWQRGAVPILYSGAVLLAVGDRWAKPTAGFRLHWHRS